MNTVEEIKQLNNKKNKQDLINLFDVEFIDYESLDLVDYDKVIMPSQYGFDGRNDKKFKRALSSKFDDMIKEIQHNEECSYITCVNNILKSGLCPKRISVMDKESDEQSVKNEAIATKLLNYFGVPTSYNLPAKNKDKFHTISVDFNSENEEFVELYSLLPATEKEYFIEKTYRIVEVVEYYLKKMFNNENVVNFEKNLDKFRKNLVTSFFIRQFILGDIDCNMTNAGLLVNTETWNFKFVNFDLEWSLNNFRGADNFNFDYAMRKYKPEVKDICKKCGVLLTELNKENQILPMSALVVRNNLTKILSRIDEYEKTR